MTLLQSRRPEETYRASESIQNIGLTYRSKNGWVVMTIRQLQPNPVPILLHGSRNAGVRVRGEGVIERCRPVNETRHKLLGLSFDIRAASTRREWKIAEFVIALAAFSSGFRACLSQVTVSNRFKLDTHLVQYAYEPPNVVEVYSPK